MEYYLIDTNTISDYFSSNFSNSGLQFLDGIIDVVPKLSVITQIELLCWKTDSLTEQKVKNFIKESVVLPITNEVIVHCVNVRKGKKIKMPDAIIAATALANSYTLVTNNEKDFSNIVGLKIFNPAKM